MGLSSRFGIVAASLLMVGCGATKPPPVEPPPPRVTIALPSIDFGASPTKATIEQKIPLGEPFGIEAPLLGVDQHDGPIAHFILEFVRAAETGGEVVENTAFAASTKRDDGQLVMKGVITPIRNPGPLTLRVRTNKGQVAEFSLATES